MRVERLENYVVQFKKGNFDLFDDFYEQVKRPCFYNIYSLIKNHDLSEDLLQETFVRFLKSVSTLDENENVLGYLILISRNITLDYIKKHSRVREFYEHEDVESRDENEIDKTILLDKVSKILKKDQLEIFTLHVLSELTFEEIAKIMKRPLGTILWSYNNSIKKLRKEIKLWEKLMMKRL